MDIGYFILDIVAVYLLWKFSEWLAVKTAPKK